MADIRAGLVRPRLEDLPAPLRALKDDPLIKAVLAANGMDFTNVVKTTVYLLTMDDFAAMNAVYARYFPEPFPARSTVAVAGLPRGARVEIEVTAAA